MPSTSTLHASAVLTLILLSLGAALTAPPAGAQSTHSATAPAAAPNARLSSADLKAAVKLRDAALKSERAYQMLDSLVTEVGPRPAGSPGDARAVAWAQAQLRAMGFPEVRAEKVTLTAWRRGTGSARIVAPFEQELVMAAYGRSVPTPPEGLEAEVAYYPSLAALKSDTSDRARGRIVFIDQPTPRTRDGSGYGPAAASRWEGPAEAGKRGAVALALRSVGTDHHRLAHTGATGYTAGIAPIPAFAVSVPDAELIARIRRYDKPLRMRVNLQAEGNIAAESANVIAEIPGRELPDEVVMIGAHLDSWDLGQGAVDDGAGVAIVSTAAQLMLEHGLQPRRTIRVVLFANEENGFDGVKAYEEKYRHQIHHLVGESDFGAGKVWRFQTHWAPKAQPVAQAIARVLAPLGIAAGREKAAAGPDAAYLARRNRWPAIELSQDGTDYFDVHHTASDTLDKVDPIALRQNVAAWAAATWLAAQSPVSFNPPPEVTATPAAAPTRSPRPAQRP
jgi:carboxypeptidase Q